MTTAAKREIYIHGRTRDYTMEEYTQICDKALDAEEKGDVEEYGRLAREIPLDPVVAKAAKIAFGKQHLIETNADLTEANLVYGEGWLDAPEN